MRKALTLVAACAASLITAEAALAQPYGGPRPPQAQGPHGPPPQNPQMGPHGQGPYGGPGQRGQGQNYYYNGRWIGPDEWRQRGPERDRWAQNYQRRRGYHHDDGDSSSALIAGIIGFALGAAIVGSQQQAEHARTADESWDSYCARKYRSYDSHSRTFMGIDGLRHYCQ